MRKCVSLGPKGTSLPLSEQDFRSNSNAAMFTDTSTNWVRIMVDLNKLSTGGDAQNLYWNQTILNALDAQIDAAKRTAAGLASNMSVILSLVYFPKWLNGTLGWSDNDPFSDPKQLPDRMAQNNSSPDQVKKPCCRIPDDLTATGPWARVLWTICQRYNQNNPSRPSPYCWIDAIDILNEPNALYFPQMAASSDPWAPSSTRVMGCSCARMMATAASVVNSLGGRPLILAPGMIDAYKTNNTRLQTDARDFTDDILGAFQNANFSGGSNMIWSIHNYEDALYQDVPPRPTVLRNKLVGRWAGWPFADGASPQVWLNEAGIRLSTVGNNETTQANYLTSMWNRMNNDAAGAGMALITQYLFNTDPMFDSGLREPQTFSPPGAPRPAYAHPWKAITQFP